MRQFTLEVLPKFPARVDAGVGIGIERANGVYTFSADYNTVPSAGIDDPSNSYVLVQLPDGSYAKVPITVFANPYLPLIAAPPAGTDATAILQDALTTYGLFQLEKFGVYEIRQSIFFPDNSGIIGNGATIYCPAAYFNNLDLSVSGGRYGTNAVGLAVFGSASDINAPCRNVRIQDLHILGDYLAADPSSTRILCCRNVDGLRIDNVEIDGFSIGCAITLQNIRNGVVTRCHPHHFYNNTDWGGGTTSGSGQKTGIEIDNDVIAGGTKSTSLIISGNVINNFITGPVATIANGNQSDGINLIRGEGIVIANNRISFVGEGIDTFADYGTITGNVFHDTDSFAIKVTHAAQYNSVVGNNILRCNLFGIGIGNGTTDTQPTMGNVIANNIIRDIDPGNLHPSVPGTETACIIIGGDGGVGKEVRDNIIRDNICHPGTFGGACIKYSANSPLSANSVRIGTGSTPGVVGWIVNAGSIPAGTTIAVDPATNVKIGLLNPQTLNSATLATLNFDDEMKDARGEYDTSAHTWTCQIPDWYRFVLQIRGSLSIANSSVGLSITGPPIVISTDVTPANTAPQTIMVTGTSYCPAGTVVTPKASVSAGTFIVSANNTLSFFTVQSVAS